MIMENQLYDLCAVAVINLGGGLDVGARGIEL